MGFNTFQKILNEGADEVVSSDDFSNEDEGEKEVVLREIHNISTVFKIF